MQASPLYECRLVHLDKFPHARSKSRSKKLRSDLGHAVHKANRPEIEDRRSIRGLRQESDEGLVKPPKNHPISKKQLMNSGHQILLDHFPTSFQKYACNTVRSRGPVRWHCFNHLVNFSHGKWNCEFIKAINLFDDSGQVKFHVMLGFRAKSIFESLKYNGFFACMILCTKARFSHEGGYVISAISF